MSTDEVLEALRPFTPGTLLVVRFATEGGGFFEMPIERVDYVPSKDDRDAYVALVPFQNLSVTPTPQDAAHIHGNKS